MGDVHRAPLKAARLAPQTVRRPTLVYQEVLGRLQYQPSDGEKRLVLISAETIYLWHGWEGKWDLRSGCD